MFLVDNVTEEEIKVATKQLEADLYNMWDQAYLVMCGYVYAQISGGIPSGCTDTDTGRTAADVRRTPETRRKPQYGRPLSGSLTQGRRHIIPGVEQSGIDGNYCSTLPQNNGNLPLLFLVGNYPIFLLGDIY